FKLIMSFTPSYPLVAVFDLPNGIKWVFLTYVWHCKDITLNVERSALSSISTHCFVPFLFIR
ncbi:MAG: hypothetical protein ACR2MT_18510, partial [Aurantibacter sp.]